MLGRKSWLFAGSDRGGQRAAAMYSIIVTAKMNGVDPPAWLTDVLPELPSTRSTGSTNCYLGTGGLCKCARVRPPDLACHSPNPPFNARAMNLSACSE
jgi:hypothetical protein